MGANPFSGNIDELTVWDTAVLSPSDIATLYKGGTPNDPSDLVTSANLVSHWKMGDGSTPPTLNDEVGSNPGTMVNMDASNFVGDVP